MQTTRYSSLGLTLSGICLMAVLCGCSTQPYDKRASRTTQAGDAAVRYGTIGALGAGGYAAGDLIGNSPTAGALGAAAGVGLGVLATQAGDKKTMRAYQEGLLDGAEAARAEMANDIWKRQAIYGGPGPTGAEAMVGPRTGMASDRANVNAAGMPRGRARTVYVPSRTINGVVYPGGYQTVYVE